MRPVEVTPELREFLRRPENRTFLEFHEYWQRKGAGKGLPGRADIDPVDIPHLLANVFLIDVVGGSPQRFHFRLVGTRITERAYSPNRRHSGKNLRLKAYSRSSWKSRSSFKSTVRSSPLPRRYSANTEKLSETSRTPCSRAHAIVSTIRNSIRPFGVSCRRRIDASE